MLEGLKTQNGPNLQKLESVFTEELAESHISVRETDPDCYKKNVREKYIDVLVLNLKCRFPDVRIIACFSIFDPSKVPEVSNDSFAIYGEYQLHILIEHFEETFLDQAALEQEWVYLKQL